MNTRGQHLLLDIWFEENSNLDEIVATYSEMVHKEFKVVGKAEHKFEPQGLTLVYILSESHFTVHTYPEHNYISLDLYICNPKYDLEAFGDSLIKVGKVLDYRAALDTRGYRET